MKRSVPASRYLLGVHQLQDKKSALSYLICSFQMPLLCHPLGHLPQALQQEQGRLRGVGIDKRRACVVGQARSDGRMIAIGQTNDEVRIATSSDTDQPHALARQRMVRMGDGDPFLRWAVKGGSVL
jgi:hypothetical protein